LRPDNLTVEVPLPLKQKYNLFYIDKENDQQVFIDGYYKPKEKTITLNYIGAMLYYHLPVVTIYDNNYKSIAEMYILPNGLPAEYVLSLHDEHTLIDKINYIYMSHTVCKSYINNPRFREYIPNAQNIQKFSK